MAKNNLPTKTDDVSRVHEEKPDYLKALEDKGAVRSSDNFDATDVAIPRVKLLQGLSLECEQFNDAKPGLFWHSGMDRLLGPQFDFVPVSRRKKWLLVAPIDDTRGILARSDDFIHWVPPSGEFEVKLKGVRNPVRWKLAPTVAESGLDKWGTYNPDDPNSPPAATLFYEYLILLPKHLDMGPCVLSLTRSQIKKTRKGLNDKIALHEAAGRPMQALVFSAKAVKEESAQGSYFNFQFISAGFASEPLYKQATEMKDMFATYTVRDEAGAVHEEARAGGTAESDAF